MEGTLHNADVQQLLAPQEITGNTTTTLFDASNANGTVDFVLNVGAATLDGGNWFALAIKHSDDTAAASLEAVSADDVLYQDASALNDAGQANAAHRISVRPRKRYLALELTETGTASAFLSVTGFGGAHRHAPSAAAANGTPTT